MRYHDLGTWKGQLLALIINQADDRPYIPTSGTAHLGIKDCKRAQASQFVNLTVDGQPFHHVLKTHDSTNFGDDGQGMWIPLGNDVTALHGLTIANRQDGTIWNPIALQLPATLIRDSHLARAGYCQGSPTLLIMNQAQITQPDISPMVHLDITHSHYPGGSTTNMEGTHRQLGPGFSNGLGSNNTDGLTCSHRMAARKVPTVAGRTNTIVGLASNGRTNHQLAHSQRLKLCHFGLV